MLWSDVTQTFTGKPGLLIYLTLQVEHRTSRPHGHTQGAEAVQCARVPHLLLEMDRPVKRRPGAAPQSTSFPDHSFTTSLTLKEEAF